MHFYDFYDAEKIVFSGPELTICGVFNQFEKYKKITLAKNTKYGQYGSWVIGVYFGEFSGTLNNTLKWAKTEVPKNAPKCTSITSTIKKSFSTGLN